MDNVGLSDKVCIELEVGTLATLIAGLYCTFAPIDPLAIPSSLFIEIAEKLVPYLKDWDYSKWSFEKWVENSLLIAPKALVLDSIESMKDNELYFERESGRVILVVTAEM